MNYTYITLVALSIAVLGVLRAEGPATSPPQGAAVLAQKNIAKRDFYKIRVTLEVAGKEESSYVAYCSEEAGSKKLHCTGSLAVGDTGYWRLHVNACMRDDLDDSDVDISIDDLKAVGKDAEGAIVPLLIFSTTIQSRGPACYQIGQVQNMTIKVEISKAEQAVPSDGHSPSSRVPSDGSAAPADAH